MIGYVDIKKSVIDVLEAKASTVQVVANEELSGFKPPAFFVKMMPIGDAAFIDYAEKLLTINIHYFSAEKTDLANLKMLDQLNQAFFNTLKIGGRVITLKSKRHQIVDNVLQFKFDLDFTTDTDPIYDEELGYTAETTELMQELLVEED